MKLTAIECLLRECQADVNSCQRLQCPFPVSLKPMHSAHCVCLFLSPNPSLPASTRLATPALAFRSHKHRRQAP